MRDKLIKLADQVEQATGPDRELDAVIVTTLGLLPDDIPQGTPRHSMSLCPRYTASLDAAMTLVPEERAVELAIDSGGSHAAVIQARPEQWDKGFAATPALALCAAALRARANQEPTNDRN